MPTASAERTSRARSRSRPAASGITVHGVLSNVTRADRRDGSMFGGTSTDTPSADRSTSTTSLPDRVTSTSASPPPSRTPAEPDTRPSDTSTESPGPTAAASEPSASPVRNCFCASVSSAATRTADAMTVGTNGPGATARPSCSTTTTSSSRPKPEPPWSSGTCRPRKPRSATSCQNAGRSSASASSSARLAPRASRLASNSATVSARAWWSSVRAMAMAPVSWMPADPAKSPQASFNTRTHSTQVSRRRHSSSRVPAKLCMWAMRGHRNQSTDGEDR